MKLMVRSEVFAREQSPLSDAPLAARSCFCPDIEASFRFRRGMVTTPEPCLPRVPLPKTAPSRLPFC